MQWESIIRKALELLNLIKTSRVMQRQQGIHRGVMIWDQTLERLLARRIVEPFLRVIAMESTLQLLNWMKSQDSGETSGKEDGGTVLESDPGKQNHEMKDCNGKHPAIVELHQEIKANTLTQYTFCC
ncbi:hypothetical protein D5086_032996 [Populus alba]|uniref:Uncharacterized protein n=2 Tax=Populus alba TaxID=43335 RepID=A0A4U5Q8N1_POPAL|nr:hypothetical protein D5086_0000120560 [Populus alba]